jgi:multidrug transporter EmrE-like cation transporter
MKYKQPFLIFLSVYAQIFFLSIQTYNIINKNIPYAILTSIGISITWLFCVRSAEERSIQNTLAYIIGGAAGVATSILIQG